MTVNNTDKLLSRLFFSMLPVQILIFAMGSINTLIDGTVAGRLIGAGAVGVIGLYFSMVRIMDAFGAVLLGGTAVLCGRYMGRGEREKTEGIFSLNLTLTFFMGAALTAASLLLPEPIASLLGASEELKASLMQYITGYAPGILPLLFSQQIAAFLQMERQSLRGSVGIACMIFSNVAFDILFVRVLHMGVYGLALATSLSNLVYFLILVPYYFSPKAQMHYGIRRILWEDLFPMIRTGFPGAMLVFCLALRSVVLNRILLRYAGNDGLAANSSFNLVLGFFLAYCIGNGAVIRMLVSIFAGEEDRDSMKKLLRIVFSKGFLLSVIIGGIVFLASPLLTALFFPARDTNVYRLAYELFAIYAVCIPLVYICQVLTNYLQATGHMKFVNVQSVLDGFFFMIIPSLILAPFFGARGVWIANPVGMILTILSVPVYCILFWKRIPRMADEWMLLKKDFGTAAENVLDIPIRKTEEIPPAAERIQMFCESHGMGKTSSMYAALCMEELASNVVRHGFVADHKTHALNVLALFQDDGLILRMKDDCVPFDPVEMSKMVGQENPGENIGIRTVFRIADEVTYQNLLKLNVLTVTIREKDLLRDMETDFMMERRLKELSPDLHRRFRDTVFLTGRLLSGYRTLFPEYTDHSELHSMTVIDSCNRLIGKEQIEKLNEDELYVLLVGCYLHDVGMGIGEKDYELFKEGFREKQFFEEHPNATRADFVRTYHNEFSGLFIEKYADMLEIPSKEHVFAIRQIARGHRKTDLFDETEYPAEYPLPNGNTVCLPYLAALIRIADEIDVVASRNPLVLYDIDTLTDEVEIVENKKLAAVKKMKMTKEAFLLSCETNEEDIYEGLMEMAGKMQKTLDLCSEVVRQRTSFVITQKRVVLQRNQIML